MPDTQIFLLILYIKESSMFLTDAVQWAYTNPTFEAQYLGRCLGMGKINFVVKEGQSRLLIVQRGELDV